MTNEKAPDGRTAFVVAYDTERQGACLKACRKIAEVHRRRGVCATFFIVGRLLESEGAAFKELLDEPELFEIASHTYSHRMLKNHPICGPAVGPEEIHKEIFLGKQRVEDCFERACVGIRPGCSFDNGLTDAPGPLSEVAAAGLGYVSSQAWGPHYTLPAPLAEAYTYGPQGYPRLWEFPCHGWHENVLKGHNATPARLLLWPPLYPEVQRSGYVQTPREEYEVNRFFMDRAVADGMEYVSLIWHPWSLERFDASMSMLEMCFDHAVERGLPFARFDDLWRRRGTAQKQHGGA